MRNNGMKHPNKVRTTVRGFFNLNIPPNMALLDKVHFTLTRASGYRIVDLFPPRFYDNVQIRCPGVGIVDIVKPSDVDRCDSDQEDVHVTQARIIIVTALSRSRD